MTPHVCKLCGYTTAGDFDYCHHLVKDHSAEPESFNILRDVFSRRPFPSQEEDEYVTDDALKQIVGLPVDESLRMYMELRNFDRNHKKFMNVIALGRTKAMIVTEDGQHWKPESTRRCANVLLDCYINRLAKFEYSRDHWNVNVVKLVTEVPTGITMWDDKKRVEPLKHTLEMLQLLSDREYPMARTRLPPLTPDFPGRPF